MQPSGILETILYAEDLDATERFSKALQSSRISLARVRRPLHPLSRSRRQLPRGGRAATWQPHGHTAANASRGTTIVGRPRPPRTASKLDAASASLILMMGIARCPYPHSKWLIGNFRSCCGHLKGTISAGRR